MSTVTSLHPLRTASLRRWVLACVLMAWGWAWAAPLLQPSGLHVVCKANGHLELVAPASAGVGKVHAGHTGDCPLCTPPSAAPVPPPVLPDPIATVSPAAAQRPLSPPSAMTDALPPARGPPFSPSPSREE